MNVVTSWRHEVWKGPVLKKNPFAANADENEDYIANLNKVNEELTCQVDILKSSLVYYKMKLTKNTKFCFHPTCKYVDSDDEAVHTDQTPRSVLNYHAGIQ